MTTVYDIYKTLDEIAPFSTAEDWDNVGILAGSGGSAVTRALVALDCTVQAIEEAKKLGAELVITHHPVIFGGLKALERGGAPWRLAEAGLSVICAHTNLDIAPGGVNDALAAALGLEAVEPLPAGRAGRLPAPMTARVLAEHVKARLGAPCVRYTATDGAVDRVAVCGGSGSKYLPEALALGVRAFVTGEVDHHIWLEAGRLGVCVVEAGHFHTENVVVPALAAALRARHPHIEFLESSVCADGVNIA